MEMYQGNNRFTQMKHEHNVLFKKLKKRSWFRGIALACAGEGLSTYICTNGLRITRDLLSKLRDKGIAFLVSLDGEKDNHEFIRGNGTFEPIVRILWGNAWQWIWCTY